MVTHNVKAIPLNQLSPDAFTVLGGAVSSSSIDTLYRNVAWLRRGVDVRAEAIASMPFCIEDEAGNEIENEEGALEGGHEVLPNFSWAEFLNYIEGDLVLYGASYFMPVMGAYTKRVLGFKRLHPNTIQPQFNPYGDLLGFRRAVNSQNEFHSTDSIGYIWVQNRNGETGIGQSVARTALASAQMLYNMDAYGQYFFEKGAVNPTIVTIDGFERLIEGEQQRIRSWFERTVMGIRNAFSILPLGTNSSVQQLGSGIGELAVPELTDAKRQDISTALGIPQSLLFSDATNYATARQDDLHFYDKTIQPECLFLQQKLNQQLFNKFNLPYRIEFEPERLTVYQQMQLERANVVKLLVGQDAMATGILTRDEARLYLGYEPMSDDAEETPVSIQDKPEQSDGMDTQHEKYLDDLATWQRFAIKRIKDGHNVKAINFNSDLPRSVHLMIVNALLESDSVEDAKQVFSDVRNYLCHNS